MAKTYNYEWKTAEEIIANIHTALLWGKRVETLAEITGVEDEQLYRKAHALWLKLKAAFNEEAVTYDPEAYDSRLGSVGSKECREVLRTRWWDELSNYGEDDYYDITRIIECLHHGEKLETGIIYLAAKTAKTTVK